MKRSGLTGWGAFLVGIRGMCAGVILCVTLRTHALASVPDYVFITGAIAVLVASRVITPLLRALGWRRLGIYQGDAERAPGPIEVERTLRSCLGDGLSLQEAVRYLHLTQGWDVMLIYPAVVTIAEVPEKEAIRMVMLAISETALRADMSSSSARE